MRAPSSFPKALVVLLCLGLPTTAQADFCAMGDLNGDTVHNVLDVVNLVNLLLSQSGESGGCEFYEDTDGVRKAFPPDMNCDTQVNVLDAVNLINRLLAQNWDFIPPGDLDGDTYPAACDPCPGTELVCDPETAANSNEFFACAAEQQSDDDDDGIANQCEGVGGYEVFGLRFTPARGSAQGSTYSADFGVNWLEPAKSESGTYSVTISY